MYLKPISTQEDMDLVNGSPSQLGAVKASSISLSSLSSLFEQPHNSFERKTRFIVSKSNIFKVDRYVGTQDSMDQPFNGPFSQHGNKYEVFLSFNRGEDTENSFPSLLCSYLREAGISVLKSDIPLELLLSSIEGCRISIIIFSEHYVSSRRCLVELTKIMEFHRAHDQVVIPIFYGVHAFEVQNQESGFGKAFQDLIQTISPSEDEVSRWRAALIKAGSFDGLHVYMFNFLYSDQERKHIEDIVSHVLPVLDDGLVGVRSKVKEVMAMLDKHESKDAVSIGIWGRAGIGKTTLASAIFKDIRGNFEISLFLSDVGETWKRKGEVGLQEAVASVICKGIGMRIDDSNASSVRMEVMKRLSQKKVLVVADDVDDVEQLHALCGNCEWFDKGKGSRIIITTTDLHILNAFHVDDVYSVKLLSDHESLQLFCMSTFQRPYPELVYIGGSRQMAAYCKGLPLALKLLGSLMSGKDMGFWDTLLYHLKPTDDILHSMLELRMENCDEEEREIFLNIVGFHIGEDMNEVRQKLDDFITKKHFKDDSVGRRLLGDRGIITIDENNKVRMHKVLQEMGRKIMRQTSQNPLPNRGHRYEVFLSFRGEDTRATFTSHLYSALCNAGIVVFKDDVDLPRGTHIHTGLLEAIGSSKIAIIIFSEDYAGSKWCLEEVSLIMELHKSNDQVVLPVFYGLDPSDIRNQTSSFGQNFKKLIQRISPAVEAQVSNWRKALVNAAATAGIVIHGSRNESENVKTIVDSVCDILDKKYLFVADHPVGVDNRAQESITMLRNHTSGDVIMVGIWGMGGVGKTTIAKAIYNEIGPEFQGRCYLPNIREAWSQEKDRVSLQNKLLSQICKPTKMEIDCIESGKITLKDRLCHKKALVVLDDVDDLDQLKALVGGRDWFGLGSRVIITTRDKRLLDEMECPVYMLKNLEEGESIKLFSWHAFKQESPKEGFTKLSTDIATYCGGLPLALQVLGSYLFGRDAEEWERVLEKLIKIPNDRIQKKLKISFDGLDDLEKEIFLDISCFFIGMDRNDVTHILDGCGLFPDIGIKTLVDRSLLTIDEKNKLGMHDLLRDMGRQIVREQSEKDLGRRSRLWFHEDAQAVLLKHMGTEAIEGLSLQWSEREKMHFETEAFEKMTRLRLLRLDNVQLKGDYKYMSKDLKWLCWNGFPIKYIPTSFYQQELVAIDLKYSCLARVWKRPLVLKRLKILNLSHSHGLVKTPNFSNLPNLEQLILKDCRSLAMIDDSIGRLHKLLRLDLEDCIGLLSLPRSIYTLKHLKTLILSGCVRIQKLEEDIEQMESLMTLIAPPIKQVPYSLVRLKSILYLSVCGHEGLSRQVVPFLYRSWMSPTDNPLYFIPTRAGMSSSILRDMPNSIHGASAKQKSLLLEEGLETLDSLCATNCMDISNENCLGHLLIQIGKNSHVFRSLSKRVSQGLMKITKYSYDCVLPGDNYPYWMTFKGEGDSVKFRVPAVKGHDHLKGMTISCVYLPSSDLCKKACESCIISLIMIINYTKATTLRYMQDSLSSFEEAERKEIISNMEADDQVEVIVVFGNGFTVKKTAVYLIYKESFDEQMEASTSGTKHKCEEEEAHQSIRPTKAMRI